MSFKANHNDYLEPIYNDNDEVTMPEIGKSVCTVKYYDIQRKATDAIRFMERNFRVFSTSWASFFQDAPEGDFSWEQDEAGDWVLSEDEDRWRKDAYAINISRKNGVEEIKFITVDEDGNWDTEGAYEAEDEYFLRETVYHHCLYGLLKNSLYSIYVAQTGEDPLENTIGSNDPREVHSRNLASEVLDLCLSVYKLAAEAK